MTSRYDTLFSPGVKTAFAKLYVNGFSLERALEQTRKDLVLCKGERLDGVLLEAGVRDEYLPKILETLAKERGEFPVGLSLSGTGIPGQDLALQTLKLAGEYGLPIARVPQIVFERETDNKFMETYQGNRGDRGPWRDLVVITSVNTPEEAGYLNWPAKVQIRTDAVAITSIGSSEKPWFKVSDYRRIERPILAEAGVTLENIGDYLKTTNGVILGTFVRRADKDSPLNEGSIKAIMKKVRDVRNRDEAARRANESLRHRSI